jgi:two-component system, OmpR family, sensor histidine kinase KdpD
MVCISSMPEDARRLIRRGVRMAGRLNADWILVYVETPNESPIHISTDASRSLSDSLAYAKTLGGRIEKLQGADVGASLAEFARKEQVSHAVFGRPPVRRGLFAKKTPVDTFMMAAPEIDVLLVGEEAKKP